MFSDVHNFFVTFMYCRYGNQLGEEWWYVVNCAEIPWHHLPLNNGGNLMKPPVFFVVMSILLK